MADPYLQANGTLKNLLGISDAQELRRVEYAYTKARIIELQSGRVSIPQTFDAAHLKAIHHHLFRDVYEWAGHMRHEPVVIEGERVQSGPFLQKGESSFLPAPYIPNALGQIHQGILADPGLRSPNPQVFAGAAARVLGDLNYVHPFREGNGRTQRQFMDDLARTAGHRLEFSVVSAERNIQVSIAANRGDLEPLARMMREIVDPRQVEVMREAIGFMERQGVDWDRRYTAVAAYGHEHRGVLVARSEDFALVMEGRGEALRLVVTHPDQLPLLAKPGEEVHFSARGPDRSSEQDLDY